MQHTPFPLGSNSFSLEPAEDHGLSTALFENELTEPEAIGLPLEMWHPAGFHFVLNFLGHNYTIDQYYILSDEHTSNRAIVALFKGTTLPDGLTIQLPNLYILVVELLEHGKIAHIGPNDPSLFSSIEASPGSGPNNSGSSIGSHGFLRAAVAMATFGPVVVSPEFPRGPPPSPSRNASITADAFL